MQSRRSKKQRSTTSPRKRKKIAPKKRRSSKPKPEPKKKVAKRSAKQKIVKKPKRKAVRVAPPPPVWPPRESSPTLKRGKISKAPPGFERVVLDYQEERDGFSDIMEKKQKIIDFVHAKEWRETALPTSDELYDYLKWGADHFGIEIGQMYRFYLGYDLED